MTPAERVRKLRQSLLAKVTKIPHRYAKIRGATMAITIGVLFAVPLSGLARFDAWAGDHVVLFEPASPGEALVAVILGIGAFYLVTFLLNLFLARFFCGWGCPIAQVNRFSEQRRQRGRGRLELGISLGFEGLLALSVLLWWVSPRVSWDGSVAAVGLAFAALAALVVSLELHGKYWSWQFCRKLCPIGLYYSVVTAKESYGIVFDAARETCKECDLCDHICPVQIHPRTLETIRDDIGGLAIDGLPETNHCLRCGDCVQACEWVFRKEDPALVPLSFGVSTVGSSPARGRASEAEAPTKRSRTDEPVRGRSDEGQPSAQGASGQRTDEHSGSASAVGSTPQVVGPGDAGGLPLRNK